MKYAVVTGASQGIGLAIAEKLLKEGCSIAICARNKEKLLQLEAQWKAEYPQATIVIYATDISIKLNSKSFADTVLSVFPQVDLLVNNTGSFVPGNIADEPEGRLESMVATNLYSAYHVTRYLMSGLKKSVGAHIFNICSVASLKAYPAGGSYSISKYAMLGFSENLREEMRPFDIKVTSFCPGATYSPSWEGSGVPAERIMEANDIAHMLWSIYGLSFQANVEQIVMRPVKGDL